MTSLEKTSCHDRVGRASSLLVSAAIGNVARPPSSCREKSVAGSSNVRGRYYGEVTYEKVCWLIGSDGTFTVIRHRTPGSVSPDRHRMPTGRSAGTGPRRHPVGHHPRDGSSATIGEDVGVGIVLDTTVGACVGIPGEDLRSVAWDYLETVAARRTQDRTEPRLGRGLRV